MATTLIEAEDRVRALLDEQNASDWSQKNLRRWMNEGLRDLARSTRHYKGTYPVTTAAGVAEYTLPEHILAIEMAWYDDNAGQRRPLAGRHLEGMDQVWGSWQNRAGWPEFFTTVGSSPTLKLRVYPVPTVTGHILRLNIAKLPDEMPLEGDDITNVDVPAGWVDLIEKYALHLAFLKDRTVGPDGRMLWEAMYAAYTTGLRNLIASNDYLAVNREIVLDPVSGAVPLWHLSDDVIDWY